MAVRATTGLVHRINAGFEEESGQPEPLELLVWSVDLR